LKCVGNEILLIQFYLDLLVFVMFRITLLVVFYFY
jgi:hypothetical protein